eukprot:552369-Pelagomonas_calceolata.AAC.7
MGFVPMTPVVQMASAAAVHVLACAFNLSCVSRLVCSCTQSDVSDRRLFVDRRCAAARGRRWRLGLERGDAGLGGPGELPNLVWWLQLLTTSDF